jgi:uncharacterized protein YkwD
MLAVAVRRRKAGWVGLFVATLILLTVVPSAPAQASTSPERELMRRHNYQRWLHERRYLKLSPSLSLKAERHSIQMARKGYIYHSSCLSCHFSGYNWSVGGENVGVGASAQSLHRAFMDSPPHRRNVLYRAYRYVGIGAVWSKGRLWITVLFMG